MILTPFGNMILAPLCSYGKNRLDTPEHCKGSSGVPLRRSGVFAPMACPKAHISSAGTLIKLNAVGFKSKVKDKKSGGRRGEIKAWSKASRRRLLMKVSAVEWGEIPYEQLYHVDLTYPAELFPMGDKVKRDLDTLRHRLDRLFGKDGYGLWWKLEFQRRGYPELNIVLRIVRIPRRWTMSFKGIDLGCEAFLFLLRKWFARTWFEIVGSGEEKHFKAGTEVSRPKKSGRQMALYLVKYMTKHGRGDKEYQHQIPEGYNPGRWWGVINSRLFSVHWETVEVPLEKFHQLRRVLRRYLKARTGGRYVPRVYSSYSGLTVLVYEEKTLFRQLTKYVS